MPDIVLVAGEWMARLRPDVGGCFAALTFRNTPVLRESAANFDHPLDGACFPLVPYCNRIANGCFTFGKRSVHLTPNLPPQRHPLHGLGWLRPWRTVRSDAYSALLEDVYSGDGEWPWAYRAHLHVGLDASGCTIRLMCMNTSDELAPLGLGLHPYFHRESDSRLQFKAEEMLRIDSEFLPDGTRKAAEALAAWPDGATLPSELVDHCFAGWEGTARIDDHRSKIIVRGFGAPHCHVYAPPGGSELCIEPVNHLPDAINGAPDTMPLVQPGAACGIAMRIESAA